MNRDDFVPVAQIKGWIRSLCEQNRQELIIASQKSRIIMSQRGPDPSVELLDLSESEDDFKRAERFYIGAFWRYACDAIGAQGVKTALLVKWENTIVETPDWIFDQSKRQGDNPDNHAPRRYFRHIDPEEMKVITPSDLIDPSANGRGITESYFNAVQRYNDQKRLVGAQWLWPASSLPTIETLAPYVHLPNDFILKRPISGLLRSSQTDQIERQKPTGMSHDIKAFCEERGYTEKPEHVPFKFLRANFVTSFAKYETKSDDAIRQAFYRYWRTNFKTIT